ncbi:MAG: tRNA (adenosine(37)-N6)-threonylcarbamoyltransferase complex dimerization subunit type 1 TsaB [Rickettsiaceae bacterium]|nr:tRNA (adenosine(37)-N6)-threonylcarbamoyltransferase complex dimerization subunit type 1 TsaB [Rickettsiaceae bacterium]
MNKILCFDVSNNSCSVAISEGQKILYFEEERRPSMQAEKLMVIIERALHTLSINYNDLDYLAVTTGPGSFTGIRIGLAVAKGILYASNLKPIAINNFESAYYRLKMQVQDYDSAFIVLNAYRNQMYVQEFMKNSAPNKPILVNNLDLIELLKTKNGRVICTGSGMPLVYPYLQEQNNLTILPRFPTIRAIHISRLADDKIKQGETTKPFEPLYIRPPDAVVPK